MSPAAEIMLPSLIGNRNADRPQFLLHVYSVGRMSRDFLVDLKPYPYDTEERPKNVSSSLGREIHKRILSDWAEGTIAGPMIVV